MSSDATIAALLESRDEFRNIPEETFKAHLQFLSRYAPTVADEPRLAAPYLAKLCTMGCLDGKLMLELLELEIATNNALVESGERAGDKKGPPADLQLFANLLNAFDNEASTNTISDACEDAASRDDERGVDDYRDVMSRAIRMAGQ